MARQRWLGVLIVCTLAMAGCAQGIGNDESTGAGNSGASGTGGTGGSVDCTSDTTPPSVTSSTDVLLVDPVTGTVEYELSFSEPVSLDAGAVTASGGATVAITPPPPATATTFTVDVAGMQNDGVYNLTVHAAQVVDRCGNELADDVTIIMQGQCLGDEDPPGVTSETFVSLPSGTTTHSYELTFDEPATIQAGGLSIDGGATITSVTPTLPATADSFTVELGNLSGGHELVLAQSSLADACGNQAAEDVSIIICAGTSGAVTFNYTGAITTWEVPMCASANLTIEAWGAQGGSHTTSTYSGGLGAYVRGDFSLASGTELKILVGQFPGTSSNGGGGGSFVTLSDDTPLVIAGGGGGSSTSTDGATKHGSANTAGQPGAGGGGQGGTAGSGGLAGATSWNAGGGGGLLGNGAAGSSSGGYAFINGGAGGSANAAGGFGGGGSGSMYVVGGGGGGYSGGGGGGNSSGGVGGGGGSFNSGTNQTMTAGVQTGNGVVTISWQ
jgi:hypothetical protein